MRVNNLNHCTNPTHCNCWIYFLLICNLLIDLSSVVIDSAECKLSGKRKKRREQANKAAMEEQLEIDLEQQALKVVNQTPVMVKPIPIAVTTAAPPSGKKSQQPVSINIMDMITNSSSKVWDIVVV